MRAACHIYIKDCTSSCQITKSKRMKRHLYLLSFLINTSLLLAQSPGGISSPVLWVKTVPVSTNLNGQYRWQDFSKDLTLLRQYDAQGASHGSEYTLIRSKVRTYNFNPAMSLSDDQVGKEILIKGSNLSQATIIGVWGPNTIDYKTDKFLFALNGRNLQSSQFTKGKVIPSVESGKSVLTYGTDEGKNLMYLPSDSTVIKYQEKSLRIGTFYRTLQPNTSIWGEKQQAIISIGNIFSKTNVNNTSTFDAKLLNNKSFLGYTPELIVYQRLLTPLERRNVETYLAIKYGISLNMSYITGNGYLLWDLEQNSKFNNRISAYGRDTLSELYQKTTTTSYEETPYYTNSDNDLYDSFDANDSNNKSSRYRLLVMGCQQGNWLNNGEYFIYGDNNSIITTTSEPSIGGMKLMARKWTILTNKQPTQEVDKTLNWTANGLEIYTTKFKSEISLLGSSSLLSGSAVTTIPLKESAGYLAWTVGTERGLITVKFGTNNPNLTASSNDYGYNISKLGEVFIIAKGVKTIKSVTTIVAGQRIEIEKDENTISLRINGIKDINCNIQIDKADSKKIFFGSVLIEKNGTSDISMIDFRHGGFVDTGNRIELSYISQRASEFTNYRNGKSYLIIDRSGTGNFAADSIDFYPTDELDEKRYKIIFNNVFWDQDGNGKDMFTFGYKNSNILGILTKINPACTDVPSESGLIRLLIKEGIGGFNYQLSKSNIPLKNGSFYGDTLIIDKLSQGDYNLVLSEIGGMNFSNRRNDSISSQAISSKNFNVRTNAYMECAILGLNTHATLAFMTKSSASSIPTDITFDYGVVVDGSKLYAVMKGVKETTSFATISSGNTIRVERTSNQIIYYVNGIKSLTKTILSADLNRLFYAVSKLEPSSTGIYNLKSNGLLNPTIWNATDNMKIDVSKGDVVTYNFTLVPDCMKRVSGSLPDTNEDSHLSVYYKDVNDMSNVTARLQLDQPSPSILLLFDVSGNLIYKKNLPASSGIQLEDIKLPFTGVYIIKVLTNENEYSRKIISKVNM